MKQFGIYFFATALSLGLFSACTDDPEPANPDGDGYGDVTAIINDYVDNTILPTYENMKNKAWNLHSAVEELKAGVASEKIQKACDAWRATRIPWEQSEAFLFGPANLHSLDPSLDSWPLDQSQINNVLNGSNAIDGTALGENVRGFHTIEYLIFENGNAKTTLTERELEYLVVATELLRDDCIKLWSSWAGKEALSGKDADAMESAGFTPIYPSFNYQFKNAGKAGSVYISQSDAIDALIEGCMTIADEVGSQKIGGPNESKDVLKVESWYSWNSITDYANNIESIRNSYLGGVEGKRGNSLSAYVEEKNPTLNAEVLAAIESAHSAINSMQAPFRNHLTGAGVDNAMEACAKLTKTLEKLYSLKN